MSNPSPQGVTGTLRMKNQDNSESRHPAATLLSPPFGHRVPTSFSL